MKNRARSQHPRHAFLFFSHGSFSIFIESKFGVAASRATEEREKERGRNGLKRGRCRIDIASIQTRFSSKLSFSLPFSSLLTLFHATNFRIPQDCYTMSLPPRSLFTEEERNSNRDQSFARFYAISSKNGKRKPENGGEGEDGLQLTRDFLAIFGNTPVKIP